MLSLFHNTLWNILHQGGASIGIPQLDIFVEQAGDARYVDATATADDTATASSSSLSVDVDAIESLDKLH